MKNHLNITVEENKITQWKEQKKCDIEISCRKFKTKAHSDVLSTISDYFKAYLNFNKNTSNIVLNEQFVSADALYHVVNFAYTGNLEIKSDDVQDVIATASYLQVKLILDVCEKFLINSVDHVSAVCILPFAILFDLRSLTDTIVLWISENFDKFVERNEFRILSHDDFKFLLMNTNLSVFRTGIPVDNIEINILDAVSKTLTANQIGAKSTVTDLLSEIRFSEIPTKSLSKLYDMYPAFQTLDRLTFTSLTNNDLKERTFSNSMKILEHSMIHANNPHSLYDLNFVKCFEELPSINDRPIRIELWVIRWEGIIVIGGIRVEYKSRTSVLHGIRPKARHSILSEHEFDLDDDEVITSINLQEGVLIDSLSFNTNYGRTYGPYGGNGGYPSSSSPTKIRGYFHSFRGIILKGRYDHFIANIEFVWAVFATNNTVNEKHTPSFRRNVFEGSRIDRYLCRTMSNIN